MNDFTTMELAVIRMLLQGKTVPKKWEFARASLRLKVNIKLEKAVAEIEI